MASIERGACDPVSVGLSVDPALSRGRELLLWAFLAVAASPVVVDTVAHLIANPWAAYCLVFFALFVREVLRTPTSKRPWILGFGLLALGMAVELVMVRAEYLRWGRPAVALAMFGMALGIGHPRARLAVLAFLAVPLPTMIASLGSPLLEEGFLRVALAVLSPLSGGAFLVSYPEPQTTVLSAGASAMPIVAADAGPYLATCLAGLAYYTGTREDLEPSLLLRRVFGWTLLAIPIQLVALIASGLGLLGDFPTAARVGLSVGPWMLATGLVLARSGATR